MRSSMTPRECLAAIGGGKVGEGGVMCNNIRTPDGVWCKTLGDLAKAIGGDVLQAHIDAVTPAEYRWQWRDDPASCLCGVHHEKLGERMGWTIKDDPFDTLYAKPEAAP
jgi:hypothetical protein